MGYITLTDFYTHAPVILRADKIVDVEGTRRRGTCVKTGYESKPTVYVAESVAEVLSAVAEER
jgi:hypothetical protein